MEIIFSILKPLKIHYKILSLLLPLLCLPNLCTVVSVPVHANIALEISITLFVAENAVLAVFQSIYYR